MASRPMAQQLYKPAEACKIAEVAPYVLRYWETEFPVLLEGKEKIGPRTYTERDVKVIARIRELLYDEGFTVAGAKKRLEAEIEQGRFDGELKAAPPAAEQRVATGARATAAANVPITTLSEAPQAAFLGEGAKAKPSTSARASSAVSDFPDRKRVIRELKEIVRILGRDAHK